MTQTKKRSLTLIVLYAFALLHVLLIYKTRGGGMTVLIPLILMLLSFVAIADDLRQEGFKKRLIGRDRRHRADLDVLRFLAAFFAIVVHTVQSDITEDMSHLYLYTVIYIFATVCNVLYVMLSGALLLEYKEETLRDFYLPKLQ